jgi:hypothetical protein
VCAQTGYEPCAFDWRTVEAAIDSVPGELSDSGADWGTVIARQSKKGSAAPLQRRSSGS